MTASPWTLTAPHDGRLRVHTGVTGRAAKMGHRLTLGLSSWIVTVERSGESVTSVTAIADVDSLEVLAGDGGVTPMFGPEKLVARANALKCFDAERFPGIEFRASEVTATDEGYRLVGDLTIHGTTRAHTVDLRREDDGGRTVWSCEQIVRQSDFGMKPYSQLMGAMKVPDEVTVSFTTEHDLP